MKILLTGKGGQVGFELCRSLSVLGKVKAIGSLECDLRDEIALRKIVRSHKPDVIVNSAAYTAVDKAESEQESAYAINSYAPTFLAEEAEVLGALLVHFSTDYVFDGSKPSPYSELDSPSPRNIYGSSKLAGEYGVIKSCRRHLILRTSWVVGAHGNNFVKTILRLASERRSLNVVADQWGAPTSAALLADVTGHLLREALLQEKSFPYGVYHVAAGGETNWHAYAAYVIEKARKCGHHISLDQTDVHAITSVDYSAPAKRPSNSRLDTTKLRETFGFNLPHWKDGVNHVLNQILERKNEA